MKHTSPGHATISHHSPFVLWTTTSPPWISNRKSSIPPSSTISSSSSRYKSIRSSFTRSTAAIMLRAPRSGLYSSARTLQTATSLLTWRLTFPRSCSWGDVADVLDSLTGSRTFLIRSRRNLWPTTACSTGEKGRKGMNSDMRPVMGA